MMYSGLLTVDRTEWTLPIVEPADLPVYYFTGLQLNC